MEEEEGFESTEHRFSQTSVLERPEETTSDIVGHLLVTLQTRKRSETQVKAVVSAEDLRKEIEAPGLVMVYFFTLWSWPCKRIEPVLDKWSLDSQFSSLRFLEVDVDQAPSLAEEFGVAAMPTFQLYRSGVKVDEMIGCNEAALKKLIEPHM